RITVNNFLNI
ncbi:hypothetical protein D018_1637B, partial [Vibrio parahaemolyticus VP2007-007]